jgi:hypothetical protein
MLDKMAATCHTGRNHSENGTFCKIFANDAENCFTSTEDAWRKNAMLLRYLAAQNRSYCIGVQIPLHNQMMATWQVSDITAVAYQSGSPAEVAARYLFNVIHALHVSMKITTKLRLVQFTEGMGFCTADCCSDPSISPEQTRELVAQIGWR